MLFNQKRVKSPYNVAPKAKAPVLVESPDRAFGRNIAIFMAQLDDFKQKIIIEFNQKLEEINLVIKKAQKVKGEKGEPGKDADQVNLEALIEKVYNMIKIPIPKDGKDANHEYIISKILTEITPKIPTKETLIKEVIKKIPTPKTELKIVEKEIRQVDKEIDPMAIIDAIMKLPKGKRLKIDHLDGFEQTISSMFHQLSRGYLHGSGSAGNIISGESVTFSGTTGTLAHTPLSGTLRLYRGGARQQAGAANDYTLSGATITLAAPASVGEIFLADYNYN